MSEEERYADQEAEIARLTSAFAQVIERLQSEVARLESDLRVERAINRHDDEVRALCDERSFMRDLAVGMSEEER